MAKGYSTALKSLIDSGDVAVGFLVDMESNPPIRMWSWPGELSFEGETYQSVADQMSVQGSIKFSASLQSEPYVLTFDASRIRDDSHVIGQFGSADWHQRKIRIRKVLVLINADPVTIFDTLDDWRGRMGQAEITRAAGAPELLKLTCEHGLFRIRGRNLHTRTDADQRRRNPNDEFFRHTATRVSMKPNWGKSPASVPGRGYNGSGAGSSPPPSSGRDKWRRKQG